MELIGRTLGKYLIQAELGRGGMGVVYHAHDPSLDRDVAIKVLAPHLAWEQEFVQRFQREARAAARLRHPGVVTIYEVGEEQGLYYFAMEYLDGKPLSQAVRERGCFPLVEALTIVEQMSAALDYAHGQGLVHRDIKSSNIMLDRHGRAVLTDFGIVRAIEGTRLTGTGMALGTPEYMAPEQARGEEATAASDLYALGVVLYEMLTGDVPFHAPTPAAVLLKHMVEAPAPVSARNPGLSPAVERGVLWALAKEPSERPASASMWVSALQRAAAGAAPEIPTVILSALAAPFAPTVGLAAHKESPAVARRSMPTWIWGLAGAAGAALLIVVVLLALGVFRPGQELAPEVAIVESTRVSTQGAPQHTPAPTDVPAATLLGTTAAPTNVPTVLPQPTPVPTAAPTPIPTVPTAVPTVPTAVPTAVPTPIPTPEPTVPPPEPTAVPPAWPPACSSAGQSWWRPADGMVMVCVPAGDFTMGSTVAPNEQPIHNIYLDAFWVDRTEVTFGQYRQCVSAGVCTPPVEEGSTNPWFGNFAYDNYALAWVTWNQAQTYCAWTGSHLPTEAQWEKAARGTDGRAYPWGNDWDPSRCNSYMDGSHEPVPVGSYPSGASPYGALDMAGNVWEWVSDWYDLGYYTNSPSANPTGPASGNAHGIRGGSWLDEAIVRLRTTARGGKEPDHRSGHLGFRCAYGP